ncbi:MAG: isoamylase early set domain-containing protein [Desulfobia sp.]
MASKKSKSDTPVTAATKKTDKKKPRKTIQSTEFSLYAPEASQVFLAGNFNNWDPTADPMRKFKKGIHTKKIKLKPGRHEYKFVVDGEWWADPENDNRLTSDIGSENSVLEISEEVVVYK